MSPGIDSEEAIPPDLESIPGLLKRLQIRALDSNQRAAAKQAGELPTYQGRITLISGGLLS
jgi:hypothetical protein